LGASAGTPGIEALPLSEVASERKENSKWPVDSKDFPQDTKDYRRLEVYSAEVEPRSK
jgi:hypothetical protein